MFAFCLQHRALVATFGGEFYIVVHRSCCVCSSGMMHQIDDVVPSLLVLPAGTDLHDHAMVKDGRLVLQGAYSTCRQFTIAASRGATGVARYSCYKHVKYTKSGVGGTCDIVCVCYLRLYHTCRIIRCVTRTARLLHGRLPVGGVDLRCICYTCTQTTQKTKKGKKEKRNREWRKSEQKGKHQYLHRLLTSTHTGSSHQITG